MTPTLQAAALEADPRWQAVVARDARADGSFFYSVKTTGVYCRPSCGARTPRRENVRFHATAQEAERAGFRPCKRCRPKEPPGQKRSREIAALCRLLEDSGDGQPSLKALAGKLGLSPYHLHRTFRAATGLTPREYAAAHRERRVRALLGSGRSVTEAIYDAGYGSAGRFYERSLPILGMTPSEYRAGAAELVIRFAVGECSLGSVAVAATERGVCAVLLGDDPEELVHDLERRFSKARLVGGDEEFESLVSKVVGLVEAPSLAVDLPLDVRGTAFQQRVWRALRAVPPGTTTTYSKLARAIGSPRAVRAVARACADNPLAVAIPCHRVVRKDGALAGYRWGIERKRELLSREAKSRA